MEITTMKYYTIGDLSELLGITVVTIRYYEKIGLLGEIKRNSGGYRVYPEDSLSRFYFISNAKSVGFDLNEIKELLDLQVSKGSSKLIKMKTNDKISSIKNKIDILTKMKNALVKWEKVCDGTSSMDKCPILNNLYKCPNVKTD